MSLELQHPHHLLGTLPQALQVIEFPFLRRKDVNYDVAEIQQHPSGGWRSLSPVPRNCGFFQRLRDVLFQGRYLTGRFSRHDNEIVSEGCKAAQVKQNNVLGQFVCGHINNELGDFQGFQLRFLRASGGGLPRTWVVRLCEYPRV